LGDKIENNEMDRVCSMDGEGGGVCRVLVMEPEGKDPIGRPRRRWENNIKMNFQEMGSGGAWIVSSSLRIGTIGGHLWIR